MGASSLEYRFRYPLHVLIYGVGFWPLWVQALGLPTKSTWLILSADLARAGWLGFEAATSLMLALGIAFTALGALLRVWGASYVGASVVHAQRMQVDHLLADGPYRRTRNPLYLGTLLHTLGLALLMPPAGAVFAIAAIWILQVRLALAEEGFLTAKLGAVYTAYAERVPRFLPSPTPLVAAAGQRAHWLNGILSEIYMIGVVVTLAAFGWDFNATPLYKGILISFGLSLVVRAFLPPTPPPAAAAPSSAT